MVFAIYQHESATGVHVSLHPEPPATSLLTRSLWVVPEHWLWVPCFMHGTCICFTYGNVHVSVLFSQIIPPSPSPTESKSLFFISVSFLLSQVWGRHHPLSKFHMCVLIYCIGHSSILYWVSLWRPGRGVFCLLVQSTRGWWNGKRAVPGALGLWAPLRPGQAPGDPHCPGQPGGELWQW